MGRRGVGRKWLPSTLLRLTFGSLRPPPAMQFSQSIRNQKKRAKRKAARVLKQAIKGRILDVGAQSSTPLASGTRSLSNTLRVSHTHCQKVRNAVAWRVIRLQERVLGRVAQTSHAVLE
eukprot:750402-Alexandrium_andersonii.AAC.1